MLNYKNIEEFCIVEKERKQIQKDKIVNCNGFFMFLKREAISIISFQTNVGS